MNSQYRESRVRRVHAYLSGRVQGVGFRAATRDKANKLSICGVVRNLPDGRLEIIAEAQVAVLEEFLSWCRRGPSMAEVHDCLVADEVPRPGEYVGFSIR